MKRRPSAVCVLLLIVVGCGGRTVKPAPPRDPPAVRDVPDVQVNLLAMGDWGTGRDPQKQVAQTMAAYVTRSRESFSGVLLAGDNFYPKLRSVNDANWRTLFEQMYDPRVLNFPFYAALGNHDYEDDKPAVQLAYARANPASRWKLPAKWYRVDLPSPADPLVTVFMLDSNRGRLAEQWVQQLHWLQSELSKPRRARWVVCVAHHPLYSNGDHGDNGVLQREWGPIFEQHQVDLYICGHDHDLQHLEIPGKWTSFFLVGGGGARVRPMRNDRRGPFSRSVHGFAHLQFTPREVRVRMIDAEGTTIHTARRNVQGKIETRYTTGKDPAEPRTIRSITRPDATTTPATTQTVPQR